MSGGSMNYLSYRIADANFRENTPERKAFRVHLQKVAEALHTIEWNDSGDGAEGENETIRACIGDAAVLQILIEQANSAAKELKEELDRAQENN